MRRLLGCQFFRHPQIVERYFVIWPNQPMLRRQNQDIHVIREPPVALQPLDYPKSHAVI
jgi:hypothetical protein